MIDNLFDILVYDEKNPMIFTRFFFWGFLAIVIALYAALYQKRKVGFIVLGVLALFFAVASIFHEGNFIFLFWVVFAILLVLNSIFYKTNALRNAFLFFVSVFFYYKTGGLFFAILLFSTFTDFWIGFGIHRAKNKLTKKLWLALSVTLNLAVLIFFKYDYFITSTINDVSGANLEVVTHAAKWSNQLFGTSFDLGKIIPPIGISFFTFQTISYSIDIYRNKLQPVTNIADFGFYVSFFPQLVAGPIVRAADFIPQLYKPYSLDQKGFGLAFYLILKGLTKKMLIGDYLAVNLIDRVFSNPASYSGFENLSALYGYSLQVYCDFSGYTDIAIGVALLMGFYLPKNFNSPYKALNVGDFWKRWHMSLSSWLKDYLYIPMGGNKSASSFTYIGLVVVLLFVVLLSGNLLLIPIFTVVFSLLWLLTYLVPSFKLTVSTNINLMITMLLGGLWHGPTWMFVIWGGLNGVGLVIYKFWRKISPYENLNVWYVNAWKIFLTFSFITFTRIWFRGESTQGIAELFSQITSNFGWENLPEMLTAYWKPLTIFCFGLIIHWLPDKVKCAYRDWFISRSMVSKVFIASLIIFIIYQAISAELTPFIYFQF